MKRKSPYTAWFTENALILSGARETRGFTRAVIILHLPAKTDLERISDDSEAFAENAAGHAYALSLRYTHFLD